MTEVPRRPPAFQVSAFNCPHCHAFAAQTTVPLTARQTGTEIPPLDLSYVACSHCDQFTVWVNQRLVFPESSIAPLPNPDLPEDIQRDYREAASIVSRSPRGAAALLRLCIQKLCQHLGQKGDNINADVAALVAQGLPKRIQQALDILRVIGNEAVHPGSLDLHDDVDTALKLFSLVNLIAQDRITEPKQIEDLYGTLPEGRRQAIEERDRRAE